MYYATITRKASRPGARKNKLEDDNMAMFITNRKDSADPPRVS